MMVCHDSERIYGLQLTLKMHRFYYRNEMTIIKKYKLEQYYDHVNEMVAQATPRRMSLIGNTSRNCEYQSLKSQGNVQNIWIYSDRTGVRAMKMKLTSGMKFNYGTDDRSGLTE